MSSGWIADLTAVSWMNTLQKLEFPEPLAPINF